MNRSSFYILSLVLSLCVCRPAVAGTDPTEGWSAYARYGDYLSTQMKSLRKFGCEYTPMHPGIAQSYLKFALYLDIHFLKRLSHVFC